MQTIEEAIKYFETCSDSQYNREYVLSILRSKKEYYVELRPSIVCRLESKSPDFVVLKNMLNGGEFPVTNKDFDKRYF